MIKIVNDENLRKIWEVLPNARLVGGCVRDSLLNLSPKDIDLATPENPETVLKIFSDKGYQVIETGISHGTVTIMINGTGYEITTLRKDVLTDGRHAIVEYVSDWETDHNRRDFTINAMYIDRYGQLYDYSNGKQDLENNTIKFVGNAEERIQEDALRILRYFRFVSRFKSYNIDNDAKIAIKNNVQLLNNLSSERVLSEFTKIFNTVENLFVFNMMKDLGVLKQFFGDVQDYNKDFKSYLEFFSFVSKGEENFMKKFKASNDENKFVNNVNKMVIVDFDENVLKYLTAIENYSIEEIKVKLNLENIQYNFNDDFVIPLFPITGQDLIDIGFNQGPEIGEILKYLKSIWSQNNFVFNKEELLERI